MNTENNNLPLFHFKNKIKDKEIENQSKIPLGKITKQISIFYYLKKNNILIDILQSFKNEKLNQNIRKKTDENTINNQEILISKDENPLNSNLKEVNAEEEYTLSLKKALIDAIGENDNVNLIQYIIKYLVKKCN